MNINEIAEMLEVDEAVVRESVQANGFSTTKSYDEGEEYLIKMHVSYTMAFKEAENLRNSFKYQDGEEQVDKSKVYDNYRKHYQDLYDRWQRAKQDFLDSRSKDEGSAFHLRKRADFLDAKPNRVRPSFRRRYGRR